MIIKLGHRSKYEKQDVYKVTEATPKALGQ